MEGLLRFEDLALTLPVLIQSGVPGAAAGSTTNLTFRRLPPSASVSPSVKWKVPLAILLPNL